MKIKLLILATLLLAVFAITLSSCDEDGPIPPESLLGKWKLEGFWDGDARMDVELPSLIDPTSYMLEFTTKTTEEYGSGYVWFGNVVAQDFSGVYRLKHSSDQMSFRVGLSTFILDVGGQPYTEALYKVSRYRLLNDKLDLYYEGSKCLRYIKVK